MSSNGTSSDTPDVRLADVTKRFDDVTAVESLSLDIPHGSFFALLGPSGCGKTTTLRMIGGFEQPTEGEIFLGERSVTGLPPYRRDVNTVFQSYALFPHLNVHDNVAFGLRRKGRSAKDAAGPVKEILGIVGLEGMEKRKPRQLSGGQQQRVALARALVNSPRVLLLDEPLGALDLKLRKQMQLELKGIQHDIEITFIHVTHDQEEAMTMADTIAVMNRGRIEQLGTPTELYETPKTAFVAGFLGISNLLRGRTVAQDRVSLNGGPEVRVSRDALRDRNGGEIAVGFRPEKIEFGNAHENVLEGRIVESAYVGVATQYIVETACGRVTVYSQNSKPGGPGADGPVQISWSPEATFVVDPTEEAQ